MNGTARLSGILALALTLAAASPGEVAAGDSAPAAGATTPLLLPDRIKADTLVVLAHPDDEGIVAPLIARYALVEKQRVVVLYLTAGASGMDKVGAIQGPAFGYMRLTELHWTLDRLGVAMFHALGRADLNPPDDPAQVLAAWGRDATVRELTRYMRLLRPDRVMTWIPGPAAEHPAHMAAGAAALLAARAAAAGGSYPEQLATEGLRVHTATQVFLFGQPEKLDYPRYPIGGAAPPPPGVIVETVPVDTYEPTLHRRLSDVARQAMKEQRSVGMGTGFPRGGAFDQPLRLVHAFDEPGAATDPPPPAEAKGAGLGLTLKASGSQLFFEQVLAEVGASRLVRAFPPRAPLASTTSGEISVTAANEGSSRVEGSAALTLPKGWTTTPGRQELSIGAGETRLITWSINAPPPSGTRFEEGSAVIESGGKRGRELARLALVIDRGPAAESH